MSRVTNEDAEDYMRLRAARHRRERRGSGSANQMKELSADDLMGYADLPNDQLDRLILSGVFDNVGGAFGASMRLEKRALIKDNETPREEG